MAADTIRINITLSAADLDKIDAARGETPRSQYLRESALARARGTADVSLDDLLAAVRRVKAG